MRIIEICYFEMPRKRPNELRECDWSKRRTSGFNGACDTQGIKNNIFQLFS